MAVKNPFIRYKIYSTSTDQSDGKALLKENVKVVCVISDADNDRIPFLKKILAAAKLSEDKHQIIRLEDNEVCSAAEQGWFEQLDYILLFGISATSISVQIPVQWYSSYEINHTRILQLPGLDKIETVKNEKQKLWQLMKKEFLHE